MTHRDDPFGQLWHGTEAPDGDELRALARLAAAEPQRAGTPPTAHRRVRARWRIAAAAAVLILVGSGLGFSLASSLTPSGTAGRNVVGFGFLPGRGWNVIQSGGLAPGTTRAVASKDGITLSVTSAPRGDPAADAAYVIRQLPLRIADARRVSEDPMRLYLRAGIGGYNVDARISFQGLPTTAMVAAAQGQLNRLVVAAARVTIAVRPATSSPLTTMVTVFGTIDSGKAGESVTVQTKECDNTFFRVYAGANTEAGGSWSTVIYPSISMKLRAVWNGETSTEVSFRKRALLGLRQLSRTRFRIGLAGYGTRFFGKRVEIQRFDQRLGRWETIRKVALSSSYATYVRLRVSKGTRLRAFLPNAQAAPCYLGGASPVIRT
jgi:hypothetical protein